ncbi:hypothetical protein [Limibacillus halophilus]
MSRLFTKTKQPKILAVASGGGHWIQLLRLRPAFEGANTVYVSVQADQAADVAPHRFHQVPDANRSTKLMLAWQLMRILYILLRERPSFVISTGAAPGYLAIRLGGLMGARTLFIDSIANAEQLSLSGHLASAHADVMLTQWPSLAKDGGPQYRGSVL